MLNAEPGPRGCTPFETPPAAARLAVVAMASPTAVWTYTSDGKTLLVRNQAAKKVGVGRLSVPPSPDSANATEILSELHLEPNKRAFFSFGADAGHAGSVRSSAARLGNPSVDPDRTGFFASRKAAGCFHGKAAPSLPLPDGGLPLLFRHFGDHSLARAVLADFPFTPVGETLAIFENEHDDGEGPILSEPYNSLVDTLPTKGSGLRMQNHQTSPRTFSTTAFSTSTFTTDDPNRIPLPSPSTEPSSRFRWSRTKVLKITDPVTNDDVLLVQEDDITELKQAQQRVELELAKSKAKSDFVANLSHEIRTPLHGVIGLLQYLNGTPMSEDQASCLDTALHSATSLLVTLNDLLDLSKIEAGKMEIHPGSHPVPRLAHLAEETLELFGVSGYRQGLALSLDYPLELHQQHEAVTIDLFRLKQIIFNLVSNSCKYTSNGGVFMSLRLESGSGGPSSEVNSPRPNKDDYARFGTSEKFAIAPGGMNKTSTSASYFDLGMHRRGVSGTPVTASSIGSCSPGVGSKKKCALPKRKRLIFTVRDTGRGISQEKLSTLFGRYIRVGSTASTDVEGHGLGLAIVKALTELMNGRITVESTIGVGSLFSFQMDVDVTPIPTTPNGKISANTPPMDGPWQFPLSSPGISDTAGLRSLNVLCFFPGVRKSMSPELDRYLAEKCNCRLTYVETAEQLVEHYRMGLGGVHEGEDCVGCSTRYDNDTDPPARAAPSPFTVYDLIFLSDLCNPIPATEDDAHWCDFLIGVCKATRQSLEDELRAVFAEYAEKRPQYISKLPKSPPRQVVIIPFIRVPVFKNQEPVFWDDWISLPLSPSKLVRRFVQYQKEMQYQNAVASGHPMPGHLTRPGTLTRGNRESSCIRNEKGLVLLVEDNLVNQKVAVKLLSKWPGLRVVVANNGAEAVQLFKERLPPGTYEVEQTPDSMFAGSVGKGGESRSCETYPARNESRESREENVERSSDWGLVGGKLDEHFALIMMDLQMPVMDGFAATLEIRNLELQYTRKTGSAIRTPIVCLSAHAMVGVKEETEMCGADSFLSKPLMLPLLEAEISKYIGEASSSNDFPVNAKQSDWGYASVESTDATSRSGSARVSVVPTTTDIKLVVPPKVSKAMSRASSREALGGLIGTKECGDTQGTELQL